MTNKPTYEELEQKNKKLEMEVLNHVHKEIEFSKKQNSIDNSHMRRTISLLKINEEQNSEIINLKRASKEDLKVASNKIRERIKEKPELEDKQFFEESKKLITVIAENIALIVELEWTEIEIINGRRELIKQN